MSSDKWAMDAKAAGDADAIEAELYSHLIPIKRRIWLQRAVLLIVRALEDAMRKLSEALGGVYIPSPLWAAGGRGLLTAHPLVDPARIAVAGLSYGGTCTLFLAALAGVPSAVPLEKAQQTTPEVADRFKVVEPGIVKIA